MKRKSYHDKTTYTSFAWIDWNELTMDQLVKYLEEKWRFSSSGDAYAIFKLIKFYKDTIRIKKLQKIKEVEKINSNI